MKIYFRERSFYKKKYEFYNTEKQFFMIRLFLKSHLPSRLNFK